MSRNFTVPPAFGWQTSSSRAKTYYEAKVSEKSKDKVKDASSAHLWSNAAKVAGYAPGLGLAVGVGRLASVIVNRKDAKGKAGQVARAIGEIFAMGPLLFLADLVKHISRSFKAKKVN